MTGRKTLREIRDQLAAARAQTQPTTVSAEARETLEALDRLADELEAANGGGGGAREPSSQDAAGRTTH